MMSAFRSGVLYFAFLVAATVAGVSWYEDFLHDTVCLFSRIFPAKARGIDRFLSCSNIEQSVLLPRDGTVVEAGTDTPGWSMFVSPTGRGRLRIRFILQSKQMAFYPRLSSPDDRIVILEDGGNYEKKVLYDECGQTVAWTPVGRKMSLCSGCVSNGWIDKEFSVNLVVILEGNAQLWHKNNTVFF